MILPALSCSSGVPTGHPLPSLPKGDITRDRQEQPHPHDIPDDLITPKEAAKLIPGPTGKGVHIQTIYRWIAQNRLIAYGTGRHQYVSRADVMAQLAPRPNRNPPHPKRTSMSARRATEILRAHGIE